MATDTIRQLIVQTPGTLGGKPRIAGRRISVQNIVIWHEWQGQSAGAIAAEYDLDLSDVYAALAYHFDHREEIDQAIKDGEAFAEALRQRTPSMLTAKLQERQQNGTGG